MKARRTRLLLIAPLLASCSSAPTPPPAPAPTTLSQISERPVVIVHDRDAEGGDPILNAIKQYKSFLDAAPKDDSRRPIAMRRMADLYLRAGEAKSIEERHLDQAARYFQSAADGYESLIRGGAPDIAALLYAQAQAYAGMARNDRMADSLRRLVKEHPESPYTAEVWFRLGEYDFARGEYASAERAYQAALAMDGLAPYHLHARYKMGWSRYKQAHFKAAVASFTDLMKIRMDALAQYGQEIETLPKTERALVDDTLRAIALCVVHLGGIASIDTALQGVPQNRTYLIYQSLAERALEHGSAEDAISIYQRYTRRFPQTLPAARFWLRVHELQLRQHDTDAAWRTLAEFGYQFGAPSTYWQSHSPDTSVWLAQQLRDAFKKLARHEHAQAQKTGDKGAYQRAATWYEAYLALFPGDAEAPDMRYLLADLLYSSGQYLAAGEHYEAFAYQFPGHPKAAEAAYAAIQARTLVEGDQGGPAALDTLEKRARRFATHFPGHPQAAATLAKVAKERLDAGDETRALSLAEMIIGLVPSAPAVPLRAAWLMKGYATYDKADYVTSEEAFRHVLTLSGSGNDDVEAIRDKLAASIYKQGEQARAAGDVNAAIAHFKKVHEVSPDSPIDLTAAYDTATLMLAREDWAGAIPILDRLRHSRVDKSRLPGIREKLALALLKTGAKTRAAEVFAQIAEDQDQSTALRQEALRKTAELNDELGHEDQAVMFYRRYLTTYPDPIDPAQAIRRRLADIFKGREQLSMERYWLEEIIRTDKGTKGSHLLAAQASLEVAGLVDKQYQDIRLTLPLKQSMARKRQAMETTLEAYGAAADYGISEVTTAATFRLGEIFHDLGRAILKSERPQGLSEDDLADYNAALEEQAYPLEEQAIGLHVDNIKRIRQGLYDRWIQSSLDQLAELFPARYRRKEQYDAFIQPKPPEAAK
ncbi:MAG: tetratricopeptide repeat protein [Gammaproteobacteria bacterium]|nr:tetratricopeptide repeat protein [Gammaproteobacteria bacterium]